MKQLSIGSGVTLWFADEDGSIYWQYQSRFEEAESQVTSRGYRYVQVGSRRHLVHRLIADTFIPNPDNKPCVNHIDGNKLNNAASNLGWVTHRENMRHAFDNGLYPVRKGSRQNNAKLTEEIVAIIKGRLSDGESGVVLAKEYGVAHGRIYDIKHGRSWQHVEAAKRAAGLEK